MYWKNSERSDLSLVQGLTLKREINNESLQGSELILDLSLSLDPGPESGSQEIPEQETLGTESPELDASEPTQTEPELLKKLASPHTPRS